MDSPVFANVRIPSNNDLVFKDECCFSFDIPELETGLYVCLNRFIGLGKAYVESYFNLTGNNVFLHIKKIKKEKKVQDEPEAKKPTRLAIGIEGGFSSGENNNFEYDEKLTVVTMPGWIKHSNQNLPAKVTEAIDAVMKADSAAKKAEMEKLTGTWDGEMRIVSAYAKDLVQLDNGKKIPPAGWKCECCEIKENLWMNLTDGSIKCGRQFFDGSGGNNHALEHYKATGYPLAVKLGTINPSGADVFSYAEDDMVEDPYLPAHLAHFGIDILKMHKTDKSMVEMEVELNQRAWEWSTLCESDAQLQPMYGPSFTGLWNLGNSCYINSVIQVLFNCLPSFKEKYYNGAIKLSGTDDLVSPAKNFQIQIRKLAHGLLSGDYSVCSEDASPQAVKPTMFKNLIGQGHVEFSTNKQQDVAEYILHLFSIIEKHTDASTNPTNVVKFKYEDRIECLSSGKVRYLDNRYDYILQLPVDLSWATNKAELQEYEDRKKKVEGSGGKIDPKEQVRAHIRLQSCLENFTSPCIIDDFYSPAIQAKTQAKKSTKLSTLPDYLFVQIQKFTMGEDWLEKKLDISLEAPDIIDMGILRGRGRQEGEMDLPEAPQQAPAVVIDTGIVSQLMEMGFPQEGSKRAAYHTSGQGFEAAVNWVMEHSSDADFDTEFKPPSANQNSSFVPDDSHLEMLQCMGFPRDVCVRALKLTNNNLEEAVEKVTTGSVPDEDLQPSQAPSFFTDGASKYELQAFISHMGSSCKSGHYVCHILKGDKWVIYNDEKVALSHKPPKDLAYIYLYKRVDS